MKERVSRRYPAYNPLRKLFIRHEKGGVSLGITRVRSDKSENKCVPEMHPHYLLRGLCARSVVNICSLCSADEDCQKEPVHLKSLSIARKKKYVKFPYKTRER